MTKIEEIVSENFNKDPETNEYCLNLNDIKEVCQKYAEFYAMECLEIAETHLENEDKDFRRVWPLSIKLPKHE